LRRQRERWCNPVVRITSDTVAGGIREQLFTVGDIPGVLWTPAEGSGPRPLVLIGHGGGHFEVGSSIRFFARHLGSQGAAI
jgi:dipeptidyl aminopeptidase/acylaminoacyl peptidase